MTIGTAADNLMSYSSRKERRAVFENLQDRLNDTLKKLTGQGRITEKNMKAALKDIRMGFLEADVNFEVARSFSEAVKEKALGAEVLRSLTPGQQFIKIVYDELVTLLGSERQEINLRHRAPAPFLLVGLQGSGKTTTAAKLANYLKELKKSAMLVPADVYRPAAIEQLKTLAAQNNFPVYDTRPDSDPVDACGQALEEARVRGIDVVIFDTAGRLQIDEKLMEELRRIKQRTEPAEILLVADGMTGQEAVNVARGFHEALEITGVILTKMEGDARGGAALSIKAVTGAPIKFLGVGEKIDALELFHPDRMASRIIGMGDLLSFIEKAQKTFEEEQTKRMQEHMMKGMFSLEDFYDALRQMRKMGPLQDVLGMLPGMRQQLRQIKDLSPAEDEMIRIEAIISSMTKEERANHSILNGNRRKRIAMGSGATVQDVNRVVKQYLDMKKVMAQVNKIGVKGLMRAMPGMFRKP